MMRPKLRPRPVPMKMRAYGWVQLRNGRVLLGRKKSIKAKEPQ